MMKSKWLKIARTALILVGSFALSIGLWVHFTKKELAREAAIQQAKDEEEWNKRYPVKGRRTDLGETSSLPTAGAPPLDAIEPGKKTERPRMRISRGED